MADFNEFRKRLKTNIDAANKSVGNSGSSSGGNNGRSSFFDSAPLSGNSAQMSNQVIGNWLAGQDQQQQYQSQQQQQQDNGIERLRRLAVQNQRQSDDNSIESMRKANELESAGRDLMDFSEAMSNSTGFNEAYQKAKDNASLGNVVDAAAKFVTGLPGQIVGGISGAPVKLGEAISGSNIQEMKEKNNEDYISTKPLDFEQRAATAADGVIDFAGIPFGGSGKIVKGVAKAAGIDFGKRGTSLAGDIITGAAEEAGEEYTQAWLENIRGTEKEHGVANALSHASEINAEAMENAALGAAGGAIMGGAGHGLGKLGERFIDSQKAKIGSSTTQLNQKTPDTPRKDYDQAPTITTNGNVIAPAEAEAAAQTESNKAYFPGAQSAKNANYDGVGNDQLGLHEHSMGFDDLMAGAMNTEVDTKAHMTESSQAVYKRLFGDNTGEFSAALQDYNQRNNEKLPENWEEFWTLPNVNTGDLNADKATRGAEMQKRISFINDYLSDHKDANGQNVKGRNIWINLSKNPAALGRAHSSRLKFITAGARYQVNHVIATQFNSDHDGDVIQSHPADDKRIDIRLPFQRQVQEVLHSIPIRYKNGKTGTANVSTDDMKFSDMFAMPNRKGRASENAWNAIKDAMSQLGFSHDQILKHKRNFDMVLNFKENEDEIKGGKKHLEVENESTHPMVTWGEFYQAAANDYLQNNNTDYNGLVTGNKAQDLDILFFAMNRREDVAYLEELSDVVFDMDKNARDSLAQSILDATFATSAEPLTNIPEQSQTIGKGSKTMSDWITTIGKHLTFGNINSPAFFRQNQNTYLEGKGVFTNAFGKKMAPDFIRAYTATMMNIASITNAPTDLIKQNLKGAVLAEVNLRTEGMQISNKEQFDQFVSVFADAWNENVKEVRKAYKEITPKGVEDMKVVLPSEIGVDGKTGFPKSQTDWITFNNAFSSLYGNRSIESFCGNLDNCWDKMTFDGIVDMAITNNVSYMDAMFPNNPWLNTFIKGIADGELAKARQNQTILINQIEDAGRLTKGIVERMENGEVSLSDVGTLGDIMSWLYLRLPKMVGIRNGIVDPTTVFDKANEETTKYLRAFLEAKSTDARINALFSMKLADDYRHVFTLLQKAEKNPDKADAYLLQAAYEASKADYSQVHRAINNALVVMDEDGNITDVRRDLLSMLCNIDNITWAEKQTILTEELNQNRFFINEGAPLLTWVMNGPDANSTMSTATTRNNDALKFLKSAQRQDTLVRQTEWREIWNHVFQNGGSSGGTFDLISTLNIIRQTHRNRAPIDIMTGAVEEGIRGSGRNDAEKGVSPYYAVGWYDGMQNVANGATVNTIDQTTGSPLGLVKREQFMNDPYILLSAMLDGDFEARVEGADGKEYVLNRDNLFKDIPGYDSSKPETDPTVINAYVEKNPQVLSVFCEQEQQMSTMGDIRVAYSIKNGLMDTFKKYLDMTEADFKYEQTREEFFTHVAAEPEGMQLILSFIKTKDGNVPSHEYIRRQLLDIKADLFDMCYYLVSQYNISKKAGDAAKEEIFNHFGGKNIRDLETMLPLLDKYSGEFQLTPEVSAAVQSTQQAIMDTVAGEQTIGLGQEFLVENAKLLGLDSSVVDLGFTAEQFNKQREKVFESFSETITAGVTNCFNYARGRKFGAVLALQEMLNSHDASRVNKSTLASYLQDVINNTNNAFDQLVVEAENKINALRLTNDPDEAAMLGALEQFVEDAPKQKANIQRTVDNLMKDNGLKGSWGNGKFSLPDADINIVTNPKFAKVTGYIPTMLWHQDILASIELGNDSHKIAESMYETMEYIRDNYDGKDDPASIDKLENLIEDWRNGDVDAQRDLDDLFYNWNGQVFQYYARMIAMADPSMQSNSDFGSSIQQFTTAIGNMLSQDWMSYDSYGGMIKQGLDQETMMGRDPSPQVGRGNWKKLSPSPFSKQNAWLVSQVTNSAATGNVHTGVAMDNLPTRMMLAVFSLDADTICDTPGEKHDFSKESPAAWAIQHQGEITNLDIWYRDMANPDKVLPLTHSAINNQELKGKQVEIFNAAEHAKTCSKVGCKLCYHHPVGTTAKNYLPLKNIMRLFLDACEPLHLKAKKSLKNAFASTRQIQRDPDLIAAGKFKLNGNANITADMVLSKSTNYRSKLQMKMADIFINDEKLKIIEFGDAEANVLSSALSQYITLYMADGSQKTVTYKQLQHWSREAAQAAQNGKPVTFDQQVGGHVVDAEQYTMSMTGLAQFGWANIESKLRDPANGKATTANFAKWADEAFDLKGDADLGLEHNLDELISSYSNKTKYVGLHHRFDGDPTASARWLARNGWVASVKEKATKRAEKNHKLAPVDKEGRIKQMQTLAKNYSMKTLGQDLSNNYVLCNVFTRVTKKRSGIGLTPLFNKYKYWRSVTDYDKAAMSIVDSNDYDTITHAFKFLKESPDGRDVLFVPKEWVTSEIEIPKGVRYKGTFNGYNQYVQDATKNLADLGEDVGRIGWHSISDSNLGIALITNEGATVNGDGTIMVNKKGSVYDHLNLSENGAINIPVFDDLLFNGKSAYPVEQVKFEDLDAFSALDNIPQSDLPGIMRALEDAGVLLDLYERDYGIGKREAARSIYEWYQDSKTNNSTTPSGTIHPRSCIGMLSCKGRNGDLDVRYQPMLIVGNIPDSSTIQSFGLTIDGRWQVRWTGEWAISDLTEGMQKAFLYPSYKAMMHEGEVQIVRVGVADPEFDYVLSKEAAHSRMQDIDSDILAKNLLEYWSANAESSLFVRKSGTGYEWNPNLNKEIGFLFDENGEPTVDFLQFLHNGRMSEKFLTNVRDKGMLKVADNTELSNMAAFKANEMISSILYNVQAKNGYHEAGFRAPWMLSRHHILYKDGKIELGGEIDAVPNYAGTFFGLAGVDHICAFFHAIQPNLVSESRAAHVKMVEKIQAADPADPHRFDEMTQWSPNSEVPVQLPGTNKVVWMQALMVDPRIGEENTDRQGPGINSNFSHQQLLKHLSEGGNISDTLARALALYADARVGDNAEVVINDMLTQDNAALMTKGVNKRQARATRTYYQDMPSFTPTYSTIQAQHNEDKIRLYESYMNKDMPVWDADDNVIDPTKSSRIQAALSQLNKHVFGSANGAYKFDTYTAINLLNKLYTGYSYIEGNRYDHCFESNVVKALNHMTETFDNKGLILPGGKTGDFYNMCVIPDAWSKPIYENSKKLQQKHGSYEQFKAAMQTEFKATTEAINNVTDYKRKAALEHVTEVLQDRTGLDLGYKPLVGPYSLTTLQEVHYETARALGEILHIDTTRINELNRLTEQRLKDNEAVRNARNNVVHRDPESSSGFTAFKNGAGNEMMAKVASTMARVSQTLRIANPLVAGGNLSERAVYTNMTDFILHSSSKIGVGPYKHSAKFDWNDRYQLTRDISQDQLSLDLFDTIRQLEVNGDFSLNYENFRTPKDIIEFMQEHKRGLNKVEKFGESAMDIMSGKGAFHKKMLSNFWNFFLTYGQEHAERGEAEWVELFDKAYDGKSQAQMQLESNPAQFMAFVLSPQSPYHSVAQVAMNHAKRGDMAQRSALGMVWSELAKQHRYLNAFVTTTFCPFVNYTLNTTDRVLGFIAPMSSIRYVLTNAISQVEAKVPGTEITFKQLHLEDAQLVNSLREALMIDAAKMSSTALAALIISISGAVEPPDDEDKWQNTEEWTIFGLRVQENWWLSDLLGPAMAMICWFRSMQLGKPRLDILTNKLADCLYSNPALKCGALVDELVNPYETAQDALETDQDMYGKTKQGNATPLEQMGSDGAVWAMNWMSQFWTPSIAKEIYQWSQEYNVSYKKIYKVDETGQRIVGEDGTAATQYTSYMDAKIRKLCRQNPTWGFIMDVLTNKGAGEGGTGYMASEMPKVVIYDPEQMASFNTFSMYNSDGSEKSDEEKTAVALAVISLLQGNDIEDLKAQGFAVPYETLKYTGTVIKGIWNNNTTVYQDFVKQGGLDYYKLGNGDYDLGKEQMANIEKALKSNQSYWKDFYYNVLWSDEMKQSITKYNQYKTKYDQDRDGNWYATGFRSSFMPVLIAQGTKQDKGQTSGWGNDWATPSAVTGNPMYDQNGNAWRALEPYQETVETPSFDEIGSNYTNNNKYPNYKNRYGSWRRYGRSGGYRRYRRRSGGSGGYARSYGGGSSYAKSAYPDSLSYRSYNPGEVSPFTAQRANFRDPSLDYLRPGFEVKGSRSAYRRSDY